MAPMEDQQENPWHISHPRKFLQSFLPITWKLGVKLHKGRRWDYTGWAVTERGSEPAADLLTKDDKGRHLLRCGKIGGKTEQRMWSPISVWRSVSVNDAMGDAYWARISVDVHMVPLGTRDSMIYSCGSTLTTRKSVNSFYLTVGVK